MRRCLLWSLGLLAACTPEPTEQVVTCTMLFEAVVREGPSAGLALRGLLQLPVPGEDGALAGRLYPEDGEGGYLDEPVGVVGQAEPDAVSLRFTTAEGAVLEGTGPLPAPLESCPEPLEGPLTGPEADDAGDWGGTCCGFARCEGEGGLDGSCGAARCGGCAL